MTVKAVTYDLWLTLLVDDDPRATHRLRAGLLADLLEVSLEDAVAYERHASIALNTGWLQGVALSVPELAEVVLRSAGRDLDQLEDVTAALQAPTAAAGVRLLPGAREAIEATSAQVPLGLICDTGMSSGEHLRHLIDDLGLLDAFTVTVFSDETGVPKPGAKPFGIALDALGVPPQDAVHIGDIRRRDVTGALAAGMGAIRYRGGRDDPDTETPDAPHVIGHHAEALPLLGL